MNYNKSMQSNIQIRTTTSLIKEIEPTKITKKQIFERSKSAEKRMEGFRRVLFSK